MDLQLLFSIEFTALLFTTTALCTLYIITKRYPAETALRSLDLLLIRRENGSFSYLLSAGITVSLMAGAALYVWPRWDVGGLAPYYVQLASSPFNPPADNPIPHRILTPLISYLVGLRGNGIRITNLAVGFSMVLLVYRHVRKVAGSPTDALVAAGVIAFSLPTLDTLFNTSYTDSLTFLLLFLQWRYRRKASLFYLLFLLGLLNRESVIFIVPWMAYVRLLEAGPSRRARIVEILLGLGVTLFLYAVFRLWIASIHSVQFSAMYYLSPLKDDPLFWFHASWYKWLGLFSVYKLLWVVPLVAVVFMWREHARSQVYSIALLLACTLLQYMVAYDSSRLMAQGFMVGIIAFEYLAVKHHTSFIRWVVPLFMLNLFLPQMYTAGNQVMFFYPLVWHLWK